MKHLIETTNSSSLTFEEYDRIVLDSTTDKIIVKEGVTSEVIPDEYIYNEIDNKYYQKIVGYGKPIKINATVDLNSEWVSDTEDYKYRYFKSNSNVGVNSSFSQCKVTWSNLKSITFKYMSNSEIKWDYLCVGKLDGEKFTSQPSDGDSNVYLSTKGKASGTYYEFTIECDEGEHHIWFCYQKDSGGNEGEDRGFIGVPKAIITVLDVKQGSELPMERKYGGVSAEGGKTYDINVNNVTVPNGSIVTDYKNVEKTEKAINTEYVDLGLESRTLWAKCNIGATSETDYGVYFQWGDISGISGSLLGKYSDENYSWATAPFNNGSDSYNKGYFTSHKSEWLDDKDNLKPEFDAARAIMGGDWRMPTETDFNELLSGTTNEWIEDFNGTGVNGMRFTSKTDTSKYIFIPAAGFCNNGSVYNVGSYGSVWSSSLYASGPNYAWSLGFNSGYCSMYYNNRCNGRSVRGVRK